MTIKTTGPLAVNGTRLLRDLKNLSAFGALEGGGVDRPPFSAAYAEAAGWLVGRMKEAGLETRLDAAGNILARLGPSTGPAVFTGSHVDTVPSGGWLDGALGVIASLECARRLAETGAPLARALEVCSFTDEEGSYVSLLGSRALTGSFRPEELDKPTGRGGESAADGMKRLGLDPLALGRARRAPGEIAAYVELHVEQGPVLETSKTDIGAVTAIVGIETVRYTFHGSARHAGTTPFEARRDALRGACVAISDIYSRVMGGDWGAPDFRLNFGTIEVKPGASNVVPGSARATCEVKASTPERMTEIGCRVWEKFQRVADWLELKLEAEPISFDAPASMDEGLVKLIEETSGELGLTSLRMPSGAGHDAQALAEIAPSAMIFIPSRDGISHHPAEFSTDDQIVKGANVLLGTLAKLVKP